MILSTLSSEVYQTARHIGGYIRDGFADAARGIAAYAKAQWQSRHRCYVRVDSYATTYWAWDALFAIVLFVPVAMCLPRKMFFPEDRWQALAAVLLFLPPVLLAVGCIVLKHRNGMYDRAPIADANGRPLLRLRLFLSYLSVRARVTMAAVMIATVLITAYLADGMRLAPACILGLLALSAGRAWVIHLNHATLARRRRRS